VVDTPGEGVSAANRSQTGVSPVIDFLVVPSRGRQDSHPSSGFCLVPVGVLDSVAPWFHLQLPRYCENKSDYQLGLCSNALKVPSSPSWTPIQCICDGAAKRLTLHVVPKLSLDPADYPDHLATSQELLQFIGSYSNLKLAFGGDVAWVANNYSLMKLTIAVLDRNLDMGRVRIAVDDPNEWDYINGEFDGEVRRFGNKPS
jgi:hypothetical protein